MREIKKLGSELRGFFTRSAGAFAIAVSGLAVVVWLCHLLFSIDLYRSPQPSSVQVLQLSDELENLRISIFVCAVSLTAWALVEWVLRRRGVVVEPRWLVGVPWWWRFVGAMGLWALGTVGAQTVLMLSGAESVNVPTAADYSQPSQWALAVSTVSAGVKEEPFFAALAVLGLGFLRVPVVAIVVISASARAVLHLYQGVGSAITAFVWGGVAVCAYYLFRNIWGLVFGHMLFNVGVLASVADARWLVVTSFSILVGVAIVSMVGQVAARETFGARNVSDSPANVSVGNGGVGDG